MLTMDLAEAMWASGSRDSVWTHDEAGEAHARELQYSPVQYHCCKIAVSQRLPISELHCRLGCAKVLKVEI